MATKFQVVKGAFSDNPTYDELLHKLAELAGEWRAHKSEHLVRQYHAVLLCLLTLGWNGYLSPQVELPDELLPAEYLNRDLLTNN